MFKTTATEQPEQQLTDDELAALLAATEGSNASDAAGDVADQIVERMYPGTTVVGDEHTAWLLPLIADGIRVEQARRAATTVPQPAPAS